MKLEDVTAEIRPRAPWESIDLGCALACRHLGAIWKAWLVTVVPLWILLAVLLHDHPVWFVLIVWWLKPVYDRVPLMVVSRALFGHVPTVWEVLKAWPKMMVRRFWFALFWGRFSPSRCLTLPVSELEGLRGAAYRQRVSLLERNGGEGATSATLAGVLLELAVGFGVVMLVFTMVPSEVSERWMSGVSEFFEYSDLSDASDGLLWTAAVVLLFSYMMMEPFYVSAGFALYINSRTLTEGWDIELAFKRMSGRLQRLKQGEPRSGVSVLIAVIASLFCFVGAGEVVAAGDDPREQAQEILADDDFTVHHRIVDVPVEESSGGNWDWLDALFGGAGVMAPFMGVVGQIVFYVILAAIIGGLVWLVYKNRHIFTSGGGSGDRKGRLATKEVMGMSVTPESLPVDIADAARDAWRSGDVQGALSLLYRGSIAWFVNHAHLAIDEGDTEGDCLRHVQQHADGEKTRYFSKLTEVWILMAYGKRVPDDRVLLEMCEGWPFSRLRAKGDGK